MEIFKYLKIKLETNYEIQTANENNSRNLNMEIGQACSNSFERLALEKHYTQGS